MSEPGTEAAPASTGEVASNVIDAFESTEATGTEVSETPTESAVETAPAETPGIQEPTAKELSDAAKFLLKQGHQAKKADGRDVWLPYKTVEGMLNRYVETHKTGWDGERTTLSSQTTALREQIDALRASVAGDETAFLRELSTIDPRYARFLEQKAEAPAAAVATEMPSPDITLPDGSQTYSLKGLTALLEWNTARVEAKVDERFKPFQEREKTEQKRAEVTKAREAVETKTQQQITEAQTWPLFGPLAADGTLTEFQQAVFAELQRDSAEARAANKKPTLSLEAAYIRIAGPRFSEDDGTRRTRLLKEINQAPRSTATSRTTTDAPKAVSGRSTADIAEATLARLEKGV